MRPVEPQAVAHRAAQHLRRPARRVPCALTSTSAFSIAAIACWISPPGAWRVIAA